MWAAEAGATPVLGVQRATREEKPGLHMRISQKGNQSAKKVWITLETCIPKLKVPLKDIEACQARGLHSPPWLSRGFTPIAVLCSF